MEHGATLWCVAHLPQNRDVWALTAGDGTVGLYRYRYPDKRCATHLGRAAGQDLRTRPAHVRAAPEGRLLLAPLACPSLGT
jgi:hypothetical protein